MVVRFRGWLSAWVVVGVVVGACAAGCESQQEKDAKKHQKQLEKQARRERAQHPADDKAPDQVIGHRAPAPADADRSRRGLDELPTNAKRVDVGSGPRLTYVPTRAGTVYVYDSDDDKIVLATPLRADERFVLDPDANRGTVDGRTVLGTGLSPRHRYRLYYDSGTGSSTSSGGR